MTGVQTCALPICFPVTIGGIIKKAEDIIQQRGKTLEKPYYEDVNNVPKLAEKISKGKRLNRSELQLQKNFPKELETKLQEIH